MQGPTYTFDISGGYCYIVTETKAVTCVKPTVTLNMDPGVCSLKYTTPTTVFVSYCAAPLAAAPLAVAGRCLSCTNCSSLYLSHVLPVVSCTFSMS